jgi:LPS O-antigen subunit length determinant protein (WzzB/FepE family)
MPKKVHEDIDTFKKIREDLDNLISLTAQSSDKSNINLSARFESYEQKQDELHNKRWSTFRWVVGIVILFSTVVIPVLFLVLDRMNTQIIANSQRISVIETHDKEQISQLDLEKKIGDEQKIIISLEKLIKDLEKADTRFESELKHHPNFQDLDLFKKEIRTWILQHTKEGHK